MLRTLLALAPLLSVPLLAAPPVAPTNPATAEDPVENQETCHDVAERILRPRVEAVERVQQSIVDFEEQAKRYALGQEDLGRRHALTAHIGHKQLATERAQLAEEERAVEAARAAAESAERASIAELRAAAAERRAAGADEQADDLERQIQAAEQRIADGALRFDVPGQTRTRSAADWDAWLAGRAQSVERTAKQLEDGSLRVHNPELGRYITVASSTGSAANHAKWAAEALAGTRSFKVAPLNQRHTRESLEQALERALDKLREDREQIRAGTYTVYLDLGYRGDRQHVEQLIADAQLAIVAKQQAWADKAYAHRHQNGTNPTNGSIEAEIAAAQEVISDKLAQGEAASVLVVERGSELTGKGCREALEAARKEGDEVEVQFWSRMLALWRTALDEWVAEKRAYKATREEKLAQHRRYFDEDIASDRERIDVFLARVLAQTPCGGSAIVSNDPNLARVDDHLRVLRGSGETDAESYERVDDYEDHVYVTRDGRVHGDLREALGDALRDTGLRVPAAPEAGADLLLRVQGLVGQVVALAGVEPWAEEWHAAQRVIDGFVDGIAGLDPSARDFFAQRRALRAESFDQLEQLVGKGLFFEGRLDDLIQALQKSGADQARYTQLIARLEELKVHAVGLGHHTLPRLAHMLTSMEGLTGEAAAQWQRFKAVAWNPNAGGGFTFSSGPAWSEMTRFERGMQSLAYAGAMASVIKNTSNGMPASEAIVRASADLAVDFAVGGVPVLAAAETATTLLFNGYEYATGEVGTGEATVTGAAKLAAAWAVDKIVYAGAWWGQEYAALVDLADQPGMGEVLESVDRGKLEHSLAEVERRLDALPTDDADAARLLEIRGSLRELIRAQDRARLVPELR